jgi:ribosomal protein L11 methyltransferase
MRPADDADWLQLSLTVDTAEVEAAEAALFDAGAVSVTLGEGGQDEIFEPAPGETPLWQRVRVTGLFSAGTDVDRLRQRLATVPASDGWRVEGLADRAWEREWLRHFRPRRFGRHLLVVPGQEDVDPAGRTLLRLDPGLAFGTGTHPTTALCLDWLAQLETLPPRLVDFGCGSGILALAALLLGAREAIAIDIDPQALDACRANARRNGIDPSRLRLAFPEDYRPAGDADLVLANILAQPLIELADRLCDSLRPGGRLLLSGLLSAQVAPVLDVYQRRLTLTDREDREGWARLTLERLE